MLSLQDLRSQPYIAIGLALVLCALDTSSPASATERETIVLASGPSQGVYHRLAERIRDRLAAQGLDVRIDPKPDCAESLTWLEQATEGGGEIRFAFAQQDVVGERFRTTDTPVRVVDRIAFDYLHVFVRRSLRVESIADLAGRRIWLGEEGSATRSTASRLLDHLGVTLANPRTYEDLQGVRWQRELGDLTVEDYAVKGLSQWFDSNRLDAAMLVSSPGAPDVCNLMMPGKLALLSLSPSGLRALRSQAERGDPFLRQVGFASLPSFTYLNQATEIKTLAVPVLLLTRADTNLAWAKAVRAAARQEWTVIGNESRARQGCRIPATSPEVQPMAAAGLKLLDGIDPIDDTRPASPAGWIFAAVALAALAAAALFARRWVKRRIRRAWDVAYQFVPLLRVLIFLLGTGMTIVTFLTYQVEKEINENFSTILESWWSITVYIFSGLEDRVPYTPAGRLFGTFGLFLGWICSAVATGWTAGMFVRKESPMPRKLEDHCLLLNWNERGEDLVKELHHSVLQESNRASTIVILTDGTNPSLQQQTGEAFEDVYLSIGNPTDETSLRKAHAQFARTVIILSDEKHGDDWTIRAILKLRKIAHQAKRDDLHVVAELIDAANDGTIEELAKDFPGLLESVSGLKLRTCLLSQAAISQGLVGFYKDLLSVEKGSNEVYAEDIPSEAEGWAFPEYAQFVLHKLAAEKASPVIPVGVQRKVDGRFKVLTNPKDGDEGYRLEANDKLVLIAYGPPTQKVLPVPPPSVAHTVNSGQSLLAHPASQIR